MPSYKLRREGKYWYIHGSEGRRSFHYSTRQTDKSLAQIVLDNFVREKLTPQDASPDDIGLDVVLRRYEDDKRGELTSTETADRTVAHLIAHYGDKPVSFITAATNKDYEVARRKAGWANATINRHRNTLRAALKHAVKDGKLRYAPHVPNLKVAQLMERWLTREEAKRLCRACLGQRWRYLWLFVRIALGTGARHRAILALTWDRVDLETGRIDFREPGRPETKKRRPNAPVSDDLLRALRAARKVSNREHVIVHRGEPLASIKKAFGQAVKRAKLKDVTPHTLKHTYITWLLREGVSIWDVAGLTNTSTVTISKVYGHHAQDHLKKAANALSARKVPESKEKIAA
jgi:integrase